VSALEPGDRVGPYVIEALVGMGGMGEVYRARDERLRRRVALKVVRTDREDHTGVAPDDRLIAEARAAAALRHANIVEIFDAGFDAGRTYVAMEYIDGKPLRDYVGDEGVPLAKRKRWVLQIGAALAAAHRAGLVHRDVKPDNVLVDAEGDARVLDFGLAKRVVHDTSAPTADAAPQTIAGRVVGTVSYMAPEQLAGGAPDPKWDQFAWGLLAYELMAGRHPRLTVPMPGPTAHLAQTPKMPHEIAPAIAFSDSAAIMLAIAADPARRFASMDAAVAALRGEGASSSSSSSARAAEVTRVESSRRTPAQRPSAWKRWSTAVLVGGAALGGVLVGRAMHGEGARAAQTRATASTRAPLPSVPPAVASVAPVAPRVAVAPSASAKAQTSARALPQDYRTGCLCEGFDGTLCAVGAPLHMRECHCVTSAADTVFIDDGGVSWTFRGTSLDDGQPCQGFTQSAQPSSGTLVDCAYTCPTQKFAGIHRTPCTGVETKHGKIETGLLYCY